MLFSTTLLAIFARGNAHSIFGLTTHSHGTSYNGAIWSGWSAWGDCNGGKRVRSASCLSTNPQICQGVLTEEQSCTPVVVVPEPGKIWSAWGPWGECVNGKRTRSANCISPNPDICMGVLQEQTACENPTEIWSSWSAWGACSGGQRVRTASCIANNSAICKGVLSETTSCAYVRPVRTNCSWIRMVSLNACLNVHSLCYSWWNRAALNNAQQCFTTWGYTQGTIGLFNQIFGTFLSN